LKENNNLISHFHSIKFSKKFDEITNACLSTHQLTIGVEPEEINEYLNE